MLPHAEYRSYLKRELEERCQRNPKYSLRAFARDLELHPARLSLVLNKKQGLSEKSARGIAKALGLAPPDTEHFVYLVIASDSRSKSARAVAQAKLTHLDGQTEEGRILREDAFCVISDWYHYAILELTSLKDFRSDTSWIARRLGISLHEAEQAVARLIKLGLATKVKGVLKQTDVILSTPDGVPSQAVRNFNTQILKRAIDAIHLQKVDERSISTLTIAVDSSTLPKIMGKMARFRRSLNQEIEASTHDRDKDEVYCLSTQFFRMTKKGDPK